jgi:hypothetical protein
MTDKQTYFSCAQAQAGEELGGRFAALAKPIVTGVPSYPQQPVSSPWSRDPVPPEPPLGYSVDEVPIVGEATLGGGHE